MVRGVLFWVTLALAQGKALLLDLKSGVTPGYGKPIELREKLFKFALNSVSWSSNVIDIEPVKDRPGFAKAEVKGALADSALEFLRNENPYDCSKDRSGAVRADWLAARFDNNYYPLLGLQHSQDFKSVAKKLGIPADFGDPKWKKMLYRKRDQEHESESRISRGERSVLFTPDEDGRPVWLTIDKERPGHPFRIDDRQSAGEIIFQLPNGMHGYLLVAQSDGQSSKTPAGELNLVYVAPTTLVVNNFHSYGPWGAKHFPSGVKEDEGLHTISIGSDCMTCHRNGLVGPKRGMGLDANGVKEILRERKKAAEKEPIKKEIQHDLDHLEFLNEDAYGAGVESMSNKYRDSLQRTKSFEGDPKRGAVPAPLLPDFRVLYEKPLSLEVAAKELGTSVGMLQDLLKIKDAKTTSIRRFAFERLFCRLQEGLKTKTFGSRDREDLGLQEGH